MAAVVRTLDPRDNNPFSNGGSAPEIAVIPMPFNAAILDDWIGIGSSGSVAVALSGLVLTTVGTGDVPILLGDVDMNNVGNFTDIPEFIMVLQSGVVQAEADFDER